MNPTLYALCQKPVIGAVLWISTLCSFPPLLETAPISVGTSGTVLSARFEAPVSKAYFLSAIFTFPSTDARIKDTLIGSQSGEPCYGKAGKQYDDFPEASRPSLGRPLRLRITVKNLSTNSTAYEQNVASVCQAGHNGASIKTQVLALIELQEGTFTIEVKNLESRPDLDALRPVLTIHPGGK
jgi:hypothetical protein